MKIALSTQVCRDWDWADSLRVAAETGYDGIELMICEPHTTLEKLQPNIDEIKGLAGRLGIQIAVLTPPRTVAQLAADPDYWEAVLEVAAGLGAEVIKTAPAPPPSQSATDDDFRQAGLAARQCGCLAAEYGVKLTCETYLNMITNTIAGAARFLQEADSEDVYLTLDICNLYINGDDPLEAVEVLGGRTALLHVKDGKRLAGGDWTWHPLGLGEIDFATVFALLEKQSDCRWASIECLIDGEMYVHLESPDTTNPENIVRYDLRAARQLMDSKA